MDGSSNDLLNVPAGTGATTSATDVELRAWVEDVTGGRITGWTQISGGNRCRSWAVKLDGAGPAQAYLRYQPPRPPSAEPYTVWREARIYRAISQGAVSAPKIMAVHQHHQAILTELSPGRADYRRLADTDDKQRIAEDCAEHLAKLHAMPLTELTLADFEPGEPIRTAVQRELAIWRQMYDEVDEPDPLVDFALTWLDDNIPTVDAPAVLVHGDAGPGNFLFENGHMSALLDWELAHPGDPMEDLAWFSMRSVMEPVPDFPAVIAAYERIAGSAVDLARIAYHRVFVSARVVIIRHRNVTGEPGNSIVSKALNRRLLIDAISAADGHEPPILRIEAPTNTERTALYDGVLEDLRDRIARRTTDPDVVASAKNAAKVLKYLREYDRRGREFDTQDARERAALIATLTPDQPVSERALSDLIRANRVPFTDALAFFARRVAREGALASPSSGGLATRRLPDLAN